MTEQVLPDHVLAWARQHSGRLVPPVAVAPFASVLNALPWQGMHLDWTRIDGREFDLAEVLDHARDTRIFRHRLACAWFGPGRHGVVAPIEAVVVDVDLLFRLAPGHQYVCGADLVADGELVLAFEDMAEYDGGDWLRLRV